MRQRERRQDERSTVLSVSITPHRQRLCAVDPGGVADPDTPWVDYLIYFSTATRLLKRKIFVLANDIELGVRVKNGVSFSHLITRSRGLDFRGSFLQRIESGRDDDGRWQLIVRDGWDALSVCVRTAIYLVCSASAHDLSFSACRRPICRCLSVLWACHPLGLPQSRFRIDLTSFMTFSYGFYAKIATDWSPHVCIAVVRGGFRHVQYVRPNRGPHKKGTRQKHKNYFMLQ